MDRVLLSPDDVGELLGFGSLMSGVMSGFAGFEAAKDRGLPVVYPLGPEYPRVRREDLEAWVRETCGALPGTGTP